MSVIPISCQYPANDRRIDEEVRVLTEKSSLLELEDKKLVPEFISFLYEQMVIFILELLHRNFSIDRKRRKVTDLEKNDKSGKRII